MLDQNTLTIIDDSGQPLAQLTFANGRFDGRFDGRHAGDAVAAGGAIAAKPLECGGGRCYYCAISSA